MASPAIFRRVFWPGLLVALGVAGACSVPQKDAGSTANGACVEGCAERDAGVSDAPTEAATLNPEAGPDASTRNANCGRIDDCDPDPAGSLSSCMDSEMGGAGGAGGDESGGSGPLGPASTDPPSGAPPTLACHVKQGESGPVAYCTATGTAGEGATCKQSTDCAAGLACVRDGKAPSEAGAGHCRPYCCALPSACPANTWCAPRRLFEGASTKTVPVCLPVDNCKLLEPGACEAGEGCFIKGKGATTCDVPGDGRDGEPCSCADGFVCIQSTNTCRRLCHLGATGECGAGQCVAGSTEFPSGIGICSSGE